MSDQLNIESGKSSGSVECLGMTFPSEDARREHYLALLADKLKDPAFRAQEGFPRGTDEAILAMSDPPYYTACPNPWINDFVRQQAEIDRPTIARRNEPFSADVSEGKNDRIYFAHSYHTKVPHKAIMRYILHYTNPGDIVFDGFCGTGMTGVAAALCGDTATIRELGYRVEPDGSILSREDSPSGEEWQFFSQVGARYSVLSDLSPAATFISNNYNMKSDPIRFKRFCEESLRRIVHSRGWMFRTLHNASAEKIEKTVSRIESGLTVGSNPFPDMVGEINYVAWSDVFSCPECAGEVVFWDCAVDTESGSVRDDFPCPHCDASLQKRKLDRLWTTDTDSATGLAAKQAVQRPVYISYKIGTKRYSKKPDAADLALLKLISSLGVPKNAPQSPLPEGYNTRQPIESHGLTHSHHFYTPRNLICLSDFKAGFGDRLSEAANLTSTALVASKLYRFRSQGGSLGAGGGPMNGAIYVPSLCKEIPATKLLKEHISKTIELRASTGKSWTSVISTGSATRLTNIESEVFDYIFLDPPFGGNIMYSDLNFLWEDWLGVRTEPKDEAIQNSVQGKGVDDYRRLMISAFQEAYRVLKPGRWLTVEFSNTQASIWSSIQAAIQEAGFVVANVSALDKKQGSFKAVTTTTAVKQDLVISAYKPNGGLEERFALDRGNEGSVWDFVRTHLRYLPVVRFSVGKLEYIVERDPRIIFDRMVSWFVRHNFTVPVSSQEFQAGLRQRFVERDGMVFLAEQVSDYDRRRAQFSQSPQIELFVADERSAIDWLTDFLRKRPSTRQEVQPEFMSQLGAGWKKHEIRPELQDLLEDNFLQYDPADDVPSQIHTYLSSNFHDLRNLEKSDPRLKSKAKDRWFVPDPNKAQDLEKKREKALLKEFEAYRNTPGRKLKEFRLEVLRAGFKAAWANKDYQTIVSIAHKVPDDALQEDEKLLFWYDSALTRTGG